MTGKRPYARELEVAIEASILAAKAIEVRWGTDPVVQYKSPIEPVTEADIAADRVLHRELLRAFPSYGWLSEETPDGPERLERERVWIVDPLDGTREFIAGRMGFMVSVALCEVGRPIVGVIAHPLTHQIWAATLGGGATLDGVPIRVAETKTLEAADILVSRSETKRGLLEPFDGRIHMTPAGGMANKLVQIADGRADGTFTCDRRCEWDVAAGVLIVAEAGGRVSRLDGSTMTFNQEFPKIVGVAGSNGNVHDELLATIDELSPDLQG